MARVVQSVREVVSGSKPDALVTYPGSPATHIAGWAAASGTRAED